MSMDIKTQSTSRSLQIAFWLSCVHAFLVFQMFFAQGGGPKIYQLQQELRTAVFMLILSAAVIIFALFSLPRASAWQKIIAVALTVLPCYVFIRLIIWMYA
jgi:hypothetical protein